tara:strand:+ start:118 stop:552 length:435 start_codon:yes stop_codon:yes gene_type:complete
MNTTDSTGGKMFSVTKKIILSLILTAIVFSPLTSTAKTSVIREKGLAVVTVPIILDKNKEVSHQIIKQVKSIFKENSKRFVKSKSLKGCNTNRVIGKMLSMLHNFLDKEYNEKIPMKGNMIYFFTMDPDYDSNDTPLVRMICKW